MAGYAADKTLSGMRRHASRLTPQEEEIIKVSFDSFSEDVEEDGKKVRYIASDNLRNAFKKIDATSDMADIQLLIDDIDENGDGKIDENEWTAIMSRKFLGEEDDSSFMHVFAMLDDNKDGYIPLVELRKMLMQEGQSPLSEQEVDELLMFADLDSDGLVNYRTFLRWLSAPEQYAKQQNKQEIENGLANLDSAIKGRDLQTLERRIAECRQISDFPEKSIEEAQRALQGAGGRQQPQAQPKGQPLQPQAQPKAQPKAQPQQRPAATNPGAGGLSGSEFHPDAPDDSTQFPQEDMKKVMEFSNVSPERAMAALQRSGGDVNKACQLLLS